MSPLAPPENGSQSFNHKPSINQHNLIERDPAAKFTYSMGALYGMRHGDRRAPNLGNRLLLESISRSDAVPTIHGSGTSSQNFIASTMERFQRDRRQLNQNRSATMPRHNRNASNDGQARYRDERQRQPNHGNFEHMTCTFFVFLYQSLLLCEVMFTSTNACLFFVTAHTHTLSFVL